MRESFGCPVERFSRTLALSFLSFCSASNWPTRTTTSTHAEKRALADVNRFGRNNLRECFVCACFTAKYLAFCLQLTVADPDQVHLKHSRFCFRLRRSTLIDCEADWRQSGGLSVSKSEFGAQKHIFANLPRTCSAKSRNFAIARLPQQDSQSVFGFLLALRRRSLCLRSLKLKQNG